MGSVRIEESDKEKVTKSLYNISSKKYTSFDLIAKEVIKREFNLKNLKRFFIIAAIVAPMILLFTMIGIVDGTVNYIEFLVDKTNGMLTALLGVSFTGYALFQALTNGYTLTILLRERGDELSKFEEFNLSFFGLTIAYIVSILINYILGIIIPILKDTDILMLIQCESIKLIFSTGFMYLYVCASIYLVWEMKSYVFNLFQCFNINALAQGLDGLKNINK